MKKVSLKYQFSFFVALLVAAIISAISYFAMLHEKKSLIEERMLRGKTLVRNLATASGEAILSGNELNLFSYCKDIIENEEDAEDVIILDSKGHIIAHSNSEKVGTQCSSWVCDSVRAWNDMRVTPFKSGVDTLYDYSMPMVVMDKRIGSVRVIMSNASILKKMSEIQTEIIRLSLIAVAIGILLSFVLVSIIVKPISKLAEAAEIVGGGNFEHRIKIRSRSEIGELAHTFNKMGDSLLKRKKQIAALNEASREINSTHQQDAVIEATATTVNDILFPDQALLCVFHDGRLICKSASGFTSSSKAIDRQLTLPDTIHAALLAEKSALIYPSEDLMDACAGLGLHLQSSNKQACVSPMVYEDSRKGAILIFGKQNGHPFTQTDTEFSSIIASAAAISLLNIELLLATAEKARMESELKTAEVVQKTLFPKEPVTNGKIEVHGYFKSASETGGDWYGYIDDMKNDRLSVFIGDVTGHGVPAALVTATANSFIRTVDMFKQRYNGFTGPASHDAAATDMQKKMLADPLSPSQLLATLNKIILTSAERQLAMTFFASTFDLNANKVYFANAGHEMPIIVRDSGQAKPEALVASGTRLGDKDNTDYEQVCAEVHAGDVLVWYTDGITECLNEAGEEYGSRRFLRKIRKTATQSAREICDALVNDVASFAGDTPLNDDITLVVARLK